MVLQLEVTTEEASDLLSIALVHAGREERLVSVLWTLCLGDLYLPVRFKGVSVGLAHVV